MAAAVQLTSRQAVNSCFVNQSPWLDNLQASRAVNTLYLALYSIDSLFVKFRTEWTVAIQE